MMKSLATIAILTAATPAIAEEFTAYPFNGSFDDATFGVESAIIGRGLVIDYTSYIGDMLERTAQDVGSDEKLYDDAQVFVFCSAVLSRKMMETDPNNIAFCPYGIFVADQDGEVTVGYRHYPKGAMQEVQSLLDDIAQEAVGN